MSGQGLQKGPALVAPRGTGQQDPTMKSPWENKDTVPIRMTSGDREVGGEKTAAVGSKRLIQTPHVGTSMTKTP